jgi:hypothetical protein
LRSYYILIYIFISTVVSVWALCLRLLSLLCIDTQRFFCYFHVQFNLSFTCYFSACTFRAGIVLYSFMYHRYCIRRLRPQKTPWHLPVAVLYALFVQLSYYNWFQKLMLYFGKSILFWNCIYVCTECVQALYITIKIAHVPFIIEWQRNKGLCMTKAKFVW